MRTPWARAGTAVSVLLLLALIVNAVVHSAWVASASETVPARFGPDAAPSTGPAATTTATAATGPSRAGSAPAGSAAAGATSAVEARSTIEPSAAEGSTTEPLTVDAATSAAPDPVGDLVVLGDSVPAGNACDCTPFGGLIAEDLSASEDRRVLAHTLAYSGAAVGDVLDQLDDPATRQAVRDTDVVVVTVGANNLDQSLLLTPACSSPAASACFGDALEAFRGSLTDVVGAIRSAAGDRSPRILLTGYWNVFLDGAVGRSHGGRYVGRSDVATRAFNAVVADVAGATGATYVDIYTPFKGDGSTDPTPLLAEDGDHPSAAGHRAIASAVEQALAAQ